MPTLDIFPFEFLFILHLIHCKRTLLKLSTHNFTFIDSKINAVRSWKPQITDTLCANCLVVVDVKFDWPWSREINKSSIGDVRISSKNRTFLCVLRLFLTKKGIVLLSVVPSDANINEVEIAKVVGQGDDVRWNCSINSGSSGSGFAEVESSGWVHSENFFDHGGDTGHSGCSSYELYTEYFELRRHSGLKAPESFFDFVEDGFQDMF